jgi:hypothetical protein
MSKVTIDSVEYDLENASDAAKEKFASIKYVDELILQKNNELQIAQTAKIGYSNAFKRQMAKGDEDGKNS